MITIATLLTRVRGLDAATLEVWVAQEWVRPRRQAGTPIFEEVDVARLRLILELRDDMDVGEPAIPVILSLLDQLHDTRSQMRRLAAALGQATPDTPLKDAFAPLARSISSS